jgi:hypothetical protein
MTMHGLKNVKNMSRSVRKFARYNRMHIKYNGRFAICGDRLISDVPDKPDFTVAFFSEWDGGRFKRIPDYRPP